MNSTMPQLATLIKHARQDKRIGQILISRGKLSQEDTPQVLALQISEKVRFGEAARRLGLILDADVQDALAEQFGLPCADPHKYCFSQRLTAAYNPFSPETEGLRQLRSQLLLRWFQKGRRSLAILGMHDTDDSSLLAANLAVLFSQIGKRTVLVDTNLQQPIQDTLFGTGFTRGLSEILAQRMDTEAIRQIEPFPNLFLLAAGTPPPNPSELLNRPAFEDLSKMLATEYDVVLYSTPEYSFFAESIAVASRASGVLLLAHAHRTRVSELNAVKHEIELSGAELVGSLLVDK